MRANVASDPSTTTTTLARRPLDPAERYFWLLDRLACSTIGAIAELDRVLEHGELEAAAAALQSRHPLLRTRVEVADGQLFLVEASGPVPLSVCEADAASLTVDVAALLDQPFPDNGGPMVRLISLRLGPERSAVVLSAHHALMDGRGAVTVLQQLLRWAEFGAGASPPAPSTSPPPRLHDRVPPERRGASAVRDVLSDVRAERAGLPAADGYPFHARHVPVRRTRLHALHVDPVDRLAAAARRAKATVHGLVAAAALESAAALAGDSHEPVLILATPTDLRSQVVPPFAQDRVIMATGLLCTPYTVARDASDLARRISEQTHQEYARGESHLFYRLARADSFRATEAGLDQFTSMLGAAPQNIAVSNLGVVRDEEDPVWVRSLFGALSPSANQLAFVALTTYRDRLTVVVATDEEKLPSPLADAFTADLAGRVGARLLPSGDRPSIDHATAGRRPICVTGNGALDLAQLPRRQ